MTNFFYIVFAICLLCQPSIAEPAWSYTGVPYPTDGLPEETMPALPDGKNGQAGWPYNPCAISAPRWTGDGPNHYYVAYDGDDRTAGNSGNGNPDAPRKSMPGFGPFPAGAVIFDVVVFDASGALDTSAGGKINIRDCTHITFRNGAQYGERKDRGGRCSI